MMFLGWQAFSFPALPIFADIAPRCSLVRARAAPVPAPGFAHPFYWASFAISGDGQK